MQIYKNLAYFITCGAFCQQQMSQSINDIKTGKRPNS